MGQTMCREGAGARAVRPPISKYQQLRTEVGRLAPQTDFLSSLTVDRLHSMSVEQNIRFIGYVRNVRSLRDDMEFNTPLFSFSKDERRWISRKLTDMNLLLSRIESLQKTKSDQDILKQALNEAVKEDEAEKKKEDEEEEEKKRMKKIEDDMELKLRMEKLENDARLYKIICVVIVVVVVLVKFF